MKTAVVFYSSDGNCTFAAEQIKTQINADLLQLQTKDEKKRGKVAKLFWGCGMVFSRRKPLLKPYTFDPTAYDLIILGAPVWAGSPAPPMRTFLSGTAISGKKIALFVCHAGGKGNALDKFKTMLAGNDIVSEMDFKEPLKNGTEVQQQITGWVKQISA
ncbi:MAG: flavodoxin [Treponema sp.]|jgi:flavodoxin|nr:flavodoxin [Treponema sp.]